MFSYSIRLMTLLAFTGHVLIGCCAHHTHAGECDHGEEVSQVGQVEVTHSVHAGCRHFHPQSVDAGSSIESDSTDDDHGSAPVHAPQECAEGACQFIWENTASASFDVLSLLLTIYVNAVISCESTGLLLTSPSKAPDFDGSLMSVGHRCALFQTWQV